MFGLGMLETSYVRAVNLEGCKDQESSAGGQTVIAVTNTETNGAASKAMRTDVGTCAAQIRVAWLELMQKIASERLKLETIELQKVSSGEVREIKFSIAKLQKDLSEFSRKLPN